jgi:hypothetical protein
MFINANTTAFKSLSEKEKKKVEKERKKQLEKEKKEKEKMDKEYRKTMRLQEKLDKKTMRKSSIVKMPLPTEAARQPSFSEGIPPVVRAENSALHSSVKIGNKDVIRTLLPTSSINARDTQGQTPLHIAASEGNAEVLALLVEEATKLKMEIDFSILGNQVTCLL